MYRGVVRVGKTVHSKSKQILLEEREKDIYFYLFFFYSPDLYIFQICVENFIESFRGFVSMAQ